MPPERPAGAKRANHFGIDQHPLDGLLVRQQAAKGLALLRPLDGEVERRLRDAYAGRRIRHARMDEPLLGDGKTLAIFAQPVLGRVCLHSHLGNLSNVQMITLLDTYVKHMCHRRERSYLTVLLNECRWSKNGNGPKYSFGIHRFVGNVRNDIPASTMWSYVAAVESGNALTLRICCTRAPTI